jgi:hypothetical protein
VNSLINMPRREFIGTSFLSLLAPAIGKWEKYFQLR